MAKKSSSIFGKRMRVARRAAWLSQMRKCWKLLILILFPASLLLAASPAKVGEQAPLVDVVSVYNGGFALSREGEGDYPKGEMELINSVLASRAQPEFTPDEGGGAEKRRDLFYELAAPATISSFRIRGKANPTVPRRVEIAISSSPKTGFQTVAVYDVPEQYRTAWNTGKEIDFSIPARQKISGRYLRLTLLDPKQGYFGLRYFNAHGRFDEPPALRKNFSGIYRTYKFHADAGTPTEADSAMFGQRREGRDSYESHIILHQQEGQVQGCYVFAKEMSKDVQILSVEGTLAGGAEGNLFRFTRIHKDGGERQGVITLSSDGNKMAHLAMLREIKPGDKDDGFYRLVLARVTDQPIPCATSAEKEKTPADAMKEAIDKTGKVQLYGVNFDFDSDVLRPESGAVLNEVVKLAQANPGWKFEVGGHTDSQGADAYNQNLSERRAASVVRYLTRAGVTASRLSAKGYGESRPLIPETGDSEAARAQNRRVELVKQ
ncbi:MAG: OmpA family protein [Burkholderiales bacterium]|jgi:outer membrane protein OmpA-like peptidoglycan-associated protein|nr:OmpA family protein [Burkholderiales bacterium]